MSAVLMNFKYGSSSFINHLLTKYAFT